MVGHEFVPKLRFFIIEMILVQKAIDVKIALALAWIQNLNFSFSDLNTLEISQVGLKLGLDCSPSTCLKK